MHPSAFQRNPTPRTFATVPSTPVHSPGTRQPALPALQASTSPSQSTVQDPSFGTGEAGALPASFADVTAGRRSASPRLADDLGPSAAAPSGPPAPPAPPALGAPSDVTRPATAPVSVLSPEETGWVEVKRGGRKKNTTRPTTLQLRLGTPPRSYTPSPAARPRTTRERALSDGRKRRRTSRENVDDGERIKAAYTNVYRTTFENRDPQAFARARCYLARAQQLDAKLLPVQLHHSPVCDTAPYELGAESLSRCVLLAALKDRLLAYSCPELGSSSSRHLSSSLQARLTLAGYPPANVHEGTVHYPIGFCYDRAHSRGWYFVSRRRLTAISPLVGSPFGISFALHANLSFDPRTDDARKSRLSRGRRGLGGIHSLTALPPGWSVRRSPPTTPSTADWFCPVEVSNSGIPVFVPQPVATSTPGRSNGPADNAVPNNPSVSADEVMQAAKEAVDKVHLKDLVDETGRFKIHLRKPAEAQAIFNDLNAQDALGNFSTLFEETNAFIAEDLDPRDIVDAAEFERKESRYRIKARAMLRINYVVEGLESLVNQILRLENAHRKWKTDHANSLMGALRGSASRGLLSDAFRVIQYRAAKAITLIHQRRALHDGANYPESVKSTASDFSQHIRSSNSKRMVLDKWLDHPDIFSNLTPEYQAVVLRRLGNAEGIDSELTNLQIPPDQRFKWPPSSMLVTPVLEEVFDFLLPWIRAHATLIGPVTQTPISHFLKRLKTREEGFNSKNLLILEEIRQLMMLDLPNPNRVLRSEDLPHPGREVTRSLSRNLRPPKHTSNPDVRLSTELSTTRRSTPFRWPLLRANASVSWR
ncbi:uncharacterized protein C8Q71DRAFT_722057 [Rhodofomes roseus]|uniref:Uncharacterized protein n=1 Tax=Rhodofomes roseus TaxID=34475 RepID=A0ABQ8KMN3_9APHY|nr:uncharacterized protein C8Q71DRAFT_722057 [Rhodofomes roseus]KAH9839017.1 hypothetical protein C8Q71DRAFT_722057 [Rhodofomes roseus]